MSSVVSVLSPARSRDRGAYLIAFIQLLIGAALAILVGYVFRASGYDVMQNESDAAYFFDVASTDSYDFRLDSPLLLNENSAPILLWTWTYRLAGALGLAPDPLWGILLNAGLVVASQFMILVYARRKFGIEGRPLLGLAALMSLNGVMMMFAGIHMRDAFLLLSTVISVIAFHPPEGRRSLHRRLGNFLLLLVLMVAAFLCRTEGFVVPLAIYLIAGAMKFRMKGLYIKAALFLGVAAFAAVLIWLDAFSLVLNNYESYKVLSQDESSQSSLAYYFLYDLPFPLSTFASSILLLFIKVPFWRDWLFDSYSFYVSITAVEMLLVAPAFLAVLWYTLFNSISQECRYLVLLVSAVLLMAALTSAQVRHFAVVYPCLLLLYQMRNRIMVGANRAYYIVFQYLSCGAVLLISALAALR